MGLAEYAFGPKLLAVLLASVLLNLRDKLIVVLGPDDLPAADT